MKQKEIIGSLEKYGSLHESSTELRTAGRTKIRRGAGAFLQAASLTIADREIAVAEARQLDIRLMRVAGARPRMSAE